LTNSGLGGGFSYLAQFTPDLDVTLTAIASDSSVKVVQKPRIMTSHATPATVFIGSTVPYVSGTYYGGGFGGGPSSQYQQLKVGINLTVTPYINQDGLVVMQIDEAIDEISGSVNIQGVGDVPTTTSRTLAAEVAVLDRQTIVLGGFIRSSGQDSKSGMPILKDIPLIGKLFTNSSKNKSRNELLVLMRPTVLRTPELAAAHTSVEKSRLPGIRHAEAENEAEETKRVKSAEGKLGTTPRTESPAPPANTETKVERDSSGFIPVPQ
jgi:general secretion pathway protein D